MAEHLARTIDAASELERLRALNADLLAACKETLHNIDQGAICPEDVAALRAAIARAEGQQPKE